MRASPGSVTACTVCGAGGQIIRGFCNPHYLRWRRYGDPLASKPKSPKPWKPGKGIQWIIDLVTQRPDAACGEADWPYGVDEEGYGRIAQGRLREAHRFVLALHAGPSPDGKPYALHSCDRPVCCAPGCLRWGSKADNSADKVSRGRQHRGETHPHARLTTDAVRDIRTRRAAGVTAAELAREYDVTPTAVHDVVTRKTWRHVA